MLIGNLLTFLDDNSANQIMLAKQSLQCIESMAYLMAEKVAKVEIPIVIFKKIWRRLYG